MARRVKHFGLHHVAETELRVVADVEEGVLRVIQIEEAVIRGYAQQASWPHHWVTLFVLQDLQPLARQLRRLASPGAEGEPLDGAEGEPLDGAEGKPLDADSEAPEAEGVAPSAQSLPPGGAEALAYRPVVNVYDLTDPAGCNVFVNRQAMVREGYWEDDLAIRGLLAHEHAHPLAENETTRASRRLNMALSLRGLNLESGAGGWGQRTESLLTLLADKLCLYAPREILANDMAIRSGFGEALLHLDQLIVAQTSQSVAGREGLCQHLQREVMQGTLTPEAADLLLLIGDLKGYLDLALEIAPFYRTGWEEEARELETALERDIFPYLEPQAGRAYTALRDQYITLDTSLAPPELRAWSEGTLSTLAGALAEKGLSLEYRVWMNDERQVTNDE